MHDHTRTPPREPEVGLWRAVITQAIIDACMDLPDASPKRRSGRLGNRQAVPARQRKFESVTRRQHRDRATARRWLVGMSKDFQRVCHMADLDPEAVHDVGRNLARLCWLLPQAFSLNGLMTFE